jgi:chorismate mutase
MTAAIMGAKSRDKIDAELLQILTNRMQLIDEIGHYKNENNITILQLKHWSKVVKDRLARGDRLGLDKDFLQKLLEIVHAESIRRQTIIYKENEE